MFKTHNFVFGIIFYAHTEPLNCLLFKFYCIANYAGIPNSNTQGLASFQFAK